MASFELMQLWNTQGRPREYTEMRLCSPCLLLFMIIGHALKQQQTFLDAIPLMPLLYPGEVNQWDNVTFYVHVIKFNGQLQLMAGSQILALTLGIDGYKQGFIQLLGTFDLKNANVVDSNAFRGQLTTEPWIQINLMDYMGI